MSDIRVSRDAIQLLVGQARRQIAEAAGTAAGEHAGQLLGELTRSLFEGTTGAKVPDRMPAAMERLSTQLRGLGIDATTVGEVLNALQQALGSSRTMRRERTLRAALRQSKGLLSTEDEARLREAIDDQAEAAELMSALVDAQELANKGRRGSVQ